MSIRLSIYLSLTMKGCVRLSVTSCPVIITLNQLVQKLRIKHLNAPSQEGSDTELNISIPPTNAGDTYLSISQIQSHVLVRIYFSIIDPQDSG